MKIKTKNTRWLLTLLPVAIVYIFIIACGKKSGAGGGNPDPVVLDASVTVSANEEHQVIQGFGCATVFRPTSPLTAPELDRLFNTGAGQVGLNILRIRVAADAGWRAIELENAKGAIARGAKVIATPWSPPAMFKTNNDLIGGSLKTDSSAAYATYLNSFADYMATNGAPLYAVSIQNEPDIQVSYESCDWTANEMRNFLKDHGHLITATKVMAPESFNNNQTYTNTILNDAAAAANVDIVGGHIYGSGIVKNTVAESLGKEVWMTEHLDTNTNHIANLNTAVEIHDCFTKAEFSAYIWWYGKRFYGPVGEDGLITKRGYMLSHFAKYITPGSVRLGASANSQPEVFVSAYKTAAGKIVIVAVNKYAATVKQTITINNATVSEMQPYTTSEIVNTEAGTKITVSGNSFTYELPPLSVTTLVQQ